MDRLGEKLGMDPLAFRLKNYARKGGWGSGQEDPLWQRGDGRSVPGWQPSGSAGPPLEEARIELRSCQERPRRGLPGMPPTEDHAAMSAIIKLDPDGTIELLSGL